MDFLGELFCKDVGLKDNPVADLKVRRSVRAVALDEAGKIVMLHLQTDDYHILPGGGLHGEEELMTALQREFQEEVGMGVNVTGEIGVIVTHEYCSDTIQINYCYLGKATAESKKLSYTDEEASKNPIIKHVGVDEAIALLKADKPKTDFGRFNVARDLKFLIKAKELL